MAETRLSQRLVEVTRALLELDERLANGKRAPYEARALRLARAHAVLTSWGPKP